MPLRAQASKGKFTNAEKLKAEITHSKAEKLKS